ncbi:MAG: tyrosine-protein phosphatase [Halioglobus sp.]
MDDGPADIAESLAMCRRAVEQGTTHAVTTPHIHVGRWDNAVAVIVKSVGLLRDVLRGEGVPLEIGFAGEVRLTDQLPRQVSSDAIPFYGEIDGYRVMLLEFPHGHIPPGSDKLVIWLLSRKIRPLIAHPERNKQVMRNVDSIYPFVEAGCWLQLTAGAVCGHFGEGARSAADHLLREDLVAVVASDAHNLRARPPGLREAYDSIAEGFGDARAERLFCSTPAALIEEQFRCSRKFSSIAGV